MIEFQATHPIEVLCNDNTGRSLKMQYILWNKSSGQVTSHPSPVATMFPLHFFYIYTGVNPL